jgi:Zn-dependent peptidase ImmA (M78 family)
LTELFAEVPAIVETVLWRQKPEGAQALEVEFLQLCRQFRNLERWCSAEAPVRLLEVSTPSTRPLGFADVEELAKETRKALSLGDRPARTLLAALEEDCGLKVFHLPFEPTGTAACSKSPDFGGAILLNAKNSRRRRNFDLAHELFHLLVWDTFDRREGSSTHEEKLADAFASCLLMPDDVVRTSVHQRVRDRKLSLSGLFEIARELDVSAEALLWRIHRLYDREEADTRRAIDASKRFVDALQDRGDPAPPSRPTRYQALAVAALQAGELSLGKCADYLGISRKDAQEYLAQGDASDEAIELPTA